MTKIPSLFTDPVFINGSFYIVFVAFVMNIFEILFFTIVIFPQQTEHLIKYINSIKIFYDYKDNTKPYNKFIYAYKNIISQISYNNSLYEVLKTREKQLNDTINSDLIIYIGFEIFLLLLLLIYILFAKRYQYLDVKLITDIQPESENAVQTPSTSGVLHVLPISISIESNLNLRSIQSNNISNDNSIKSNLSDKMTNNITPVILSASLTILYLVFFQVAMYNYAKSYKYIGSEGQEEIMNMINYKIAMNILY
jgi:hypothetical protein